MNTLLKATSGTRQDVILSGADDQSGEASRIAVAGACSIACTGVTLYGHHLATLAESMLQALQCADAEGRKYALMSREGLGPGADSNKWQALFAAAH